MLLDALATALATHGAQAWLVGGCLRNALLGQPAGDIDLAVTCAPLPLAEALHALRKPAIWVAPLNRDSVRVGLFAAKGAKAPQLDLSLLRGASISNDLAQRDFTVNALALPLSAREVLLARMAEIEQHAQKISGTEPIRRLPGLLDPLGGVNDLAQRTLTPASDRALHADYGRILRAARLIATYGFSASPSLIASAHATAPKLISLPGDRLRDELNELFTAARAADGLDFLAETGALTALFPTLQRPAVVAHAIASVRATSGLQQDYSAGKLEITGIEALATLDGLRTWYAAPLPDGLPRIVALRWGLLLHAAYAHTAGSAEAPGTRSDAPSSVIAAHPGWRLAKAEQTIFWHLVSGALHTIRMQLAGTHGEPVTEMQAALLFHEHGEITVDLLVAAVACNAALVTAPLDGEHYVAGLDAAARSLLELFFNDRERLIPPPLLSGSDLAREPDAIPGPAIGRVLHAVRLAQLRGDVATRDEALALARRLTAS
jgi:hypothetical protein